MKKRMNTRKWLFSGHWLTGLLCVFLGLVPAWGAADVDRTKVKKGVEAFQESRWDEALNHFQDALLDAPQDARLHFNVGDVLYKKQKYQEALQAFEKALNTSDPQLQQKAYYNMGNAYYFLNQYQEAINAYKKALELDSDDRDAKHNLELVRAKLKEMARKQHQQGGDSSSPESSGQGESSAQDASASQEQQQPEQPESGPEDQAQQQRQSQREGEEEPDQQTASPREGEGQEKELSREEAERILQALQGNKENQELRPFRLKGGKRKVEKDW